MNTHALNAQMTIDGLQWIDRWRLNNGRAESFVVPFPTTRPINIVTHGEQPFDYGQYGIHLSQQDVLTFLGDARRRIRARFIDCRKDSPTLGVSLDLAFAPSSSRTLIIPPGVAHTFTGLEGVSTLNAYGLFLPPIEDLLAPTVGWIPENDIINLPLETDPKTIEPVVAMSEPASNQVYYRLASLQAAALSVGNVSHGETRTFVLDTGEQVQLLLQPEAEPSEASSPLPSSRLKGVRFERHGAVRTGEDSRIIPIAGPSPFYIVDHGSASYDFESFGVHLGQEDHLTFMGRGDRVIRLKLVDMRQGSDTLHHEEWHAFTCDPQMELVIPCGVAHALFDMEQIFTLNRPVFYLDASMAYIPGHDVIDWPLTDTRYPSFKVNEIPAPLAYLEALVGQQQQAMESIPTGETPKAVIVTDESTGQQVKVLLTRAMPSAPTSAP